jgi:hypothetical protein
MKKTRGRKSRVRVPLMIFPFLNLLQNLPGLHIFSFVYFYILHVTGAGYFDLTSVIGRLPCGHVERV